MLQLRGGRPHGLAVHRKKVNTRFLLANIEWHLIGWFSGVTSWSPPRWPRSLTLASSPAWSRRRTWPGRQFNSNTEFIIWIIINNWACPISIRRTCIIIPSWIWSGTSEIITLEMSICCSLSPEPCILWIVNHGTSGTIQVKIKRWIYNLIIRGEAILNFHYVC